jgi:hypothetical protein
MAVVNVMGKVAVVEHPVELLVTTAVYVIADVTLVAVGFAVLVLFKKVAGLQA